MKFNYKGPEKYFAPKAIAALKDLDGITLYHTRYKLRHPLEIYTTTLHESLDKTIALQELLKKISDDGLYLSGGTGSWRKDLEQATDAWLDSIIQHIDSSKSILCCFFPEDQKKAQQKAIGNYKRQTNPLRKELAEIVNLIKHNQRFIRVIQFHWPGGFLPGFYVEGVVDDGVIGPDPSVHTDANSAISYNRYIPLIICHIFSNSAFLAQSIYDITRRKIKIEKLEFRGSDLSKMLRLTSIMPLKFFPDEIKKPIPFVRWHQTIGKDEISVHIEYPAISKKAYTVEHECQIETQFTPAEFSKTFKLPYFGKKYEKNQS